MKIGADYRGAGVCRFTVWAPSRRNVAVRLTGGNERITPLEKSNGGYWTGQAEDCPPGTRYFYRLDDEVDRPDPASHFQPEGVHGPSQVVDHDAFAWTDADRPRIPLERMVFYQLHPGTFTPQGTFDAIIPRLVDFQELGVTTLQLTPVGQFPGARNWGYDGVYAFAAQTSYGGPEGLKRLVDACHGHGLAVALDVVYNHLGPEGNYLWDYGPYFTHKYRTPWGEAINFDGPYSDEVRNYFIENALHWFRDFHADVLRLDAVHAIFDQSAKPFLRELAERVADFNQEAGHPHLLISESDLNDTRVIRPWTEGGFGHDGQWSDDFHHALHTLLTGENQGYYADFGTVADMAKACAEGFVYSWRYSRNRRRHHGSPSADRPARQFVVFSQNHDQIGNRMLGERLSALVSFEALKLAAGMVLLSPFVPMLFMGEEYGEQAPFPYFIDHGDPELVRAVREGRRDEFRHFLWSSEPPDPQSPETFAGAKIAWNSRHEDRRGQMLNYYKALLELRASVPALAILEKQPDGVTFNEDARLLFQHRRQRSSEAFLIAHFGDRKATRTIPFPAGNWIRKLDSADPRWGGEGSETPEHAEGTMDVPCSATGILLYLKEEESLPR